MYNEGIAHIVTEEAAMRAAGASENEIARLVAAMRHQFAEDVRTASSGLMRKYAEVFDAVRGNVGRPTYETLRAAGKTDAQIIASASRTNRFVNRLPSGLRWAGRIMWFVSGGISVYVILTAPKEERAQVAREEIGTFVGGVAGGYAGVGICVMAGIATGGLGLAICGLLGGFIGFEVGLSAARGGGGAGRTEDLGRVPEVHGTVVQAYPGRIETTAESVTYNPQTGAVLSRNMK